MARFLSIGYFVVNIGVSVIAVPRMLVCSPCEGHAGYQRSKCCTWGGRMQIFEAGSFTDSPCIYFVVAECWFIIVGCEAQVVCLSLLLSQVRLGDTLIAKASYVLPWIDACID